MPALSYHFGLRWSDIEDMPNGELQAYLNALEQLRQAALKR